MCLERCKKLFSNLRLIKEEDKNASDKLNEIRFYIDYLHTKFQENFYPGRDLSLDESMIPFNGKGASFKVLLRNKPIPEGFLYYDLADAKHGYILSGEIYTGRDKINGSNKSTDNSVMLRSIRILKNYLNNGHIVFGDNFYTSLEFVQYLTSQNTGWVGTLRKNRDKVKNLDQGMKRGEVRYFTTEKYPKMLLTIFYDSIIVKLLTNCMKIATICYPFNLTGVGTCIKESPFSFKEYNKKACGVDLANSLLSRFKQKVSCKKIWWNNIFTFFLMVTVNNSYIIYKENKLREINRTFNHTIINNHTKGLFLSRKLFSLEIIWELINSEGGITKKNLEIYYKGFKLQLRSSKDTRDIGNNKESTSDCSYSAFPHTPSKKEFQTECHKKTNVCLVCKEETDYHCEDCQIEVKEYFKLCIKCFEMFHKGLFSLSEDKRYSYIFRHYNDELIKD